MVDFFELLPSTLEKESFSAGSHGLALLCACLHARRAGWGLLNEAQECLSGRGRGLLTLLKIFLENVSYNVRFCRSLLLSSDPPLLNKRAE